MTDDPRAAAFDKLLTDLMQLRGAYGYLSMQMALSPPPDEAFRIAKKEWDHNEAAFRRTETLLGDGVRALCAAPDADPSAHKEADDYHRMYDEVSAERDALREERDRLDVAYANEVAALNHGLAEARAEIEARGKIIEIYERQLAKTERPDPPAETKEPR